MQADNRLKQQFQGIVCQCLFDQLSNIRNTQRLLTIPHFDCFRFVNLHTITVFNLGLGAMTSGDDFVTGGGGLSNLSNADGYRQVVRLT